MELSKEFLNRMQQMLGTEYEKFIKSMTNQPHKGLRINTLKNPPREMLDNFNITPIPWCQAGYYYHNSSPGKHPFHEQGLYYIQEPSAMAVVELANVRHDDIVLDLCAAPGGKSTHIACKLNGTGLLVANEIIPTRAKTLSQNIERMGITNAIVTNENPERLANAWGKIFDKVFVDAPCSGEGMFRKDETAIKEWTPNAPQLCHKRQLDILEQAHKLLKGGGRIIYSTCTFAPIENEGTINKFLSAHPEYTIEKVSHSFDCGNPEYINSTNKELQNCIRIFPHKCDGEGHFIAILTKNNKDKNVIKSWKQKPNKKYEQLLEKWQKTHINTRVCDNIYEFGDNLYQLEHNQLNIQNVKVLRYGLHLGTIEKNIFTPSHSLAMASKPEDFKVVIELDYQKVVDYMKGNTLETAQPNGWCLITFCNYPIGLGKIADGIVKNHYPKGLRI